MLQDESGSQILPPDTEQSLEDSGDVFDSHGENEGGNEEEDDWNSEDWDEEGYHGFMDDDIDVSNSDLMDSSTQQGPAASWAYRDLKSQREMRLLVVQPGSFDDFIRCRLVHVKTDTFWEYEAISYTWADETGDDTKTKTILLDNSPFPVTANCEAALKRIRKDSVTRTVWIDAVCINQDNKNEQGHQVQLMPDIYSRATRVLIYLGEPLDGESEGLMRLDNTRATGGSLPTPEEDPDLAASVLRSVNKAVNSLCGRRYFSRVWILQEVALARAATVICGKYEVPWGWFRSLASDMYSESSLPKAMTLVPRKHRGKSDLMNLLDEARNCHATDPRDKVFAVFGLIQCPTTLGLIPDYNATVEEVYIDAAIQIASLHGIQNLLIRACGHRNYQSLPTWVPDWSGTIPSGWEYMYDTLVSLTRELRTNHLQPAVSIIDQDRKQISFDVARLPELTFFIVPDCSISSFIPNRGKIYIEVGKYNLVEKLNEIRLSHGSSLFCFTMVYSKSCSSSDRTGIRNAPFPGSRLLLLSSSQETFDYAGFCLIQKNDQYAKSIQSESKISNILSRSAPRQRHFTTLDIFSFTQNYWGPSTLDMLLESPNSNAHLPDTVEDLSEELWREAMDKMIHVLLAPLEKALNQRLNLACVISKSAEEEDSLTQAREEIDAKIERLKEAWSAGFNITDAQKKLILEEDSFKNWLETEKGKQLSALLRGVSKADKLENLLESDKAEYLRYFSRLGWTVREELYRKLTQNMVVQRAGLDAAGDLLLYETSSLLPRMTLRLSI